MLYIIHKRPDHINTRQEFSHFEGDLTFFKGSRNVNLSVVERLSHKAFIVKNDNKRSVSVTLNLLSIKNKAPNNFMKSVTFDNGGEFA